MIKIETLRDCLQNMSKYSPHKGKVILINWCEDWNMVRFLSFNHVCLILPGNEIGSLLLDSKLNQPDNLLIPYLLSIYIEEILNVFNGSLQPLNIVSEHFKLLEHLPAHVLLRLVKDEPFVEHVRQRPPQLFPDAVHQDLLRVDLDHTHQHFVKHQHALG